MEEEFKAKTKYNDFYGTVAADRSDNYPLRDLLPDNEKLKEGEDIIGFGVCFNYNRGNEKTKAGIVLYIGKHCDDHLICDRTVDLSLYDKDIFDLFKRLKRFDLSVSFNNKKIKSKG